MFPTKKIRNWAITRPDFITHAVADTKANSNNKNQSESQWLKRTVCTKLTCLHFQLFCAKHLVPYVYGKKLWFVSLGFFPSFVCIQGFFSPFKLTPLLAAYHLSVLSDFSHLKMKYIIKPDNNCVRYVALFYSLWTNKGQVPKCTHFHAHQIICFCNTENNTA